MREIQSIQNASYKDAIEIFKALVLSDIHEAKLLGNFLLARCKK